MRHDLIERAQRGDREAFGELAEGETGRLLAIARLMLRDAYLAEDAVQETLVRCWRQLPSLRDPVRFDAWLYRILVRAASDELRRRRRREAHVQAMPIEPSVTDTTSAIAERDQLVRGFSRLSMEHRAVVVLRHYAGLPMTEIASALGIPPGTAKSRYHYAMSALRAELEAADRLTDRGGVTT
jgi:RNA polymerase sigma-70 factor (ECF subfamily)